MPFSVRALRALCFFNGGGFILTLTLRLESFFLPSMSKVGRLRDTRESQHWDEQEGGGGLIEDASVEERWV